jgi:trans-AT polyketide synthase/acyltransferase/oxidoreductase domain-containing protein
MSAITYSKPKRIIGSWQGSEADLKLEPEQIRAALQDLSSDCYLLDYQGQIACACSGILKLGDIDGQGIPAVAVLQAGEGSDFGDPAFLAWHGLKAAYMAGSMANAISGIELVTTLGKAGYLASYGSGGVSPTRLLEAITTIKKELPGGPYAFNLIHSPNEPAMEQKAVDLFLEHGIRTIEASAFLRLTPTVVQYRAAGLHGGGSNRVEIKNKVISKLSRPEVAVQFLNPPPERILTGLVEAGKITPEQARLAATIPMADDITIEADSGGHTDNRPLVGLLPSIIALRNQTQQVNRFPVPVRIGAAGGISTPISVLGAFAMGAAYVVTGSVNQACQEAGTSIGVKKALAGAAAPDVMMAPSADMFEMGVKVQVLKRGTMFPMRSQKLYDTYIRYGSIAEIPPAERQELEEKILQKNMEEIWEECVQFFSQRDPSQLEKAKRDPKRKMALVFRWYLGLATHWGIQGIPERSLDYQIWCGPAMGAFNDWVKGTSLEIPENRRVVEVADQLLQGAAYQHRLNQAGLQGLAVPPTWERYPETNV